jgi:hypothetical protein
MNVSFAFMCVAASFLSTAFSLFVVVTVWNCLQRRKRRQLVVGSRWAWVHNVYRVIKVEAGCVTYIRENADYWDSGVKTVPIDYFLIGSKKLPSK